MTIIAHLTDPHLVEDDYYRRGVAERARLSFLAFGRRIDPRQRRHRFARALTAARSARPDHLVVTGDLTEDGMPSQFEVLAEVLAESGFPPHRITLIPGNHDGYHEVNAWSRAIRGPLRAYWATSCAGTTVQLAGAVLVPISNVFAQPVFRSAGCFQNRDLEGILRAVEDPAFAGLPVAVLLHHPPLPSRLAAVQWWDGLQGYEPITQLLVARPSVFVLHGHTHSFSDRAPVPGRPARIFSAAAVIENESPLRLYAALAGELRPMTDAAGEPFSMFGQCLATA